MKRLLMLTCAVCALVYVPARAEDTPKGAPDAVPVNTDAAFEKIRACSALKDPDAYETMKMDSYEALVAGKNGWVFRTNSDFKIDFAFDKKIIKKLVLLQKMLAEKGTTLYIAYLPNRGALASDNVMMDDPLADTYDPQLARAAYANSIGVLRKAGLRMITMDHAIAPELFYRKTDQHWNTNGAREFAKIVAATLKKDAAYAAIPKIQYETVSKGDYYLDGRFGEALLKMCDITLAKEKDEEFVTSVSGKANGEAALFGDAVLPQIALVGTSYSRSLDFDTNFQGFLKESLQADVFDAAISGGGIDDPIIAYLNSADFKNAPPKILVWEIPGHYVLTSEGGRFLNEVLPTVLGECTDPIIQFNDIVMGSGGKLPLATDLSGLKIQGDGYYLHMRFDHPVEKKVTVHFNYADSDTAKFKFKRNKRYPFDGLFHVQLPDKDADKDGESTLTSIDIEPNSKMAGFKLSGQLCRMPQQVGELSKLPSKLEVQERGITVSE